MDDKFNRCTQFNQKNGEFSKNTNSKSSVNYRYQKSRKTSDMLKDDYAEMERIFRNRPKEQYGVNGYSNAYTCESKSENMKKTSRNNVEGDNYQAAVLLKVKQIRAKKARRARRRRRIISLMIVVLAVCLGCSFFVNKLQQGAWLDNNFMVEPATELDYDKVKSNYLYLYNIDEGRMTAGKNQENKMYPASLTKIMTAIVAIEKAGDPKNLNSNVTVPSNIAKKMIREGASTAGFAENEKVSYMDLLYGAMLPSGGDACLTIADQMFGSEEKMVRAMNEKAKKLDMNNTHFENVVGLHDTNHYSTARDMCKLMRYSLKNDIFKKIISTEKYTTSSTKEHPKGIIFENTVFEKINQTKKIEEKYGSLSDSHKVQYLNENGMYIIGGKTGYTEEAQLCLASYGVVDNEKYILITGKAVGTPGGEPFNMYDALYTYGQVHKAHVRQQAYIDEKLWRKVYFSVFDNE